MKKLYTTERPISKALTSTAINGVIYCIRLMIQNNKLGSADYYLRKFKNLKVDYRPDKFDYRSSHWKALGEKIFSDCFK